MNSQLAVQNTNDVAVHGESSAAIGALMQQVEAMEAAMTLAKAMCGSELVPTTYRGKPANGAAAILYGAELGLNPIQSLQQIFVVHGTPAIYARTMVALVKKHGYRVVTESSSDESVTVIGQAPDGTTETSTWTLARATKAGYVPTINEKTGKFETNANGKLIGNEKYLKDPQAMLYAKAATEVCRKLAPDVLLGISYSREELELEAPPIRVRSERVASARSVLDDDPTDDVTDHESVAEGQASTEPEPEAPQAITENQLKKLWAMFGDAGLTQKDEALAWLSNLLGREVESTKTLTPAEFQSVVDELEGN